MSIPLTVTDLGGIETDNGEKKRRGNHVSEWFITANSNVRAKQMSQASAIAEDIKQCLTEMFNNLAPYIIFGDRKVPDLEGSPEFKAPYIVKIDAEMVGEIGKKPKGGRAHVHASLRIEHTTILKLDYAKFQANLKQRCNGRNGVRGLYVDIRFVRNGLAQYLRKDLGVSSGLPSSELRYRIGRSFSEGSGTTTDSSISGRPIETEFGKATNTNFCLMFPVNECFGLPPPQTGDGWRGYD